MGIEIRPSGETAAYAAAGQTIGKAERAKEERAREERQAQHAQDLAARQRADQMAMDWELQKMQMRSKLDFQQELRDKQYEYDKFNRAKEWEVEKMGLASRFDFEQEEKERLRINAEAVAGEKTLLESSMGDEERARGLFRLWQKFPEARNLQKYSGFDTREERYPSLTSEERAKAERIEAGLLPRARQESETAQYLKNLGLDGNAVAGPGKVYVKHPNGVRGYIPVEQLEEALTNGYTLIEGQNIPKSESYQKNLNQWLVEEKFPQLIKDIESPNPLRYFAAKQESETLMKQYPSTFEQYLKKISGK